MNCFFNFKKGKTNETDLKEGKANEAGYALELRNFRAFSLDELKKATHNFKPSLVIGRGGFGNVYKGTINPRNGRGNPTTVAIKRLSGASLQGNKEWLQELHIHGGAIHRNLVELLGYCLVDRERGVERILVYRYMPNKSLHDHLLDIHLPALSWETRLQIMLGAAEGLAYLHEGLEVPIIFRDFKPSNVLLDENFRAKLSGLGSAREGPTGGEPDVSTLVVGTFGYVAPEYFATGRVSVKCDIYAYGVVLYQILTGRKPIFSSEERPEHRALVNWVKHFPADNRKLMDMIMDPRLQNQYSRRAAINITKLADRCTAWNRNYRPSMGEIIAVLKQAILESDQSKGESHSDLSIADLHFRRSESAYDAHMGRIAGKSLSDLSIDTVHSHPSECQSPTSSCEGMPTLPPPKEYHPPENQGADYNEHRLLELEKEAECKRILFLFGEGYGFEKEMLIQLWMALELLTDEEIGANYFEKLVCGGYICSVAYSLYKVNAEKLMIELDMIKNNLNYVRLDNGSRNDAASAETLHASVVCNEIDASTFKILGGFNRLKTLMFLGNYGSRLEQVPRDLFLDYWSLAALDLSGTHIKELPSSAGKMISLRYLDLSWTLIEVLPERIDRFVKLQTLRLEGCSCLRRLPKEMKGLTELRHLHLDVLGQLAAFPEGMGALVNIRTLSAFPCGSEEGLKISELKHLNNITGKFCIAKMENVQSVDEAKEASLTAKRNIKNLKLKWSNHRLQEPVNEVESILTNLCPHSDLEEMHILCYPGSSFPDWVADVSFHKLVSITLFRCVHVRVLPSLEKLPSLKSLELISLNSVTEMNCKGDADHVAFPKLQKLAIDEMLNVQRWTEAREGDYPSLVELSIKDCPKLPELPHLVYLPSIKHLEVSGCSQLAFVSGKELSPSVQQLIVENCPLIEERCSEEGGQDWYKIQHIPTIWIDQVAIQTHEDI